MNSQPVYDLLRQIPSGKVTTYGQIGKKVGLHPRTVGQILHRNQDPNFYPCFKVVNSQGKVAANFGDGGGSGQIRRLEKDHITVVNNKVDLNRYLYEFE